MDTPSTGQPVKILTTLGEGNFIEGDYVLPPLGDFDIRVKSIFTGVCRSDIDMMQGKFPLLPMQMHGHEGLGQVIDRGSKVRDWDCKIGDYVATRGEPAYADYYNCNPMTWVKVPEADPKYIIEPVACAVNIEEFCKGELKYKQQQERKRMLIIGSGFLAKVFFQCMQTWSFDIEVWGNSNKDFYVDCLISEPNGAYDIVVDLKDTPQILDVKLNDEPLIILGSQKLFPMSTDLSNWLWKSATIKMPSPRANSFMTSMKKAVHMVETGKLTLDNVWTNCYSRSNNWQSAFTDAVKRTSNYGRGYISWD